MPCWQALTCLIVWGNVMYGLIDIQRDMDDSAKAGLQEAANLESERKKAKEAIKAQQKQTNMQMAGSFAGTLATLGILLL